MREAGDKMVSVCMITYNHEKYITEAIEGVLMQKTNFLIELIIGEDCSTDNTRKICEEYQEKYPNLIKLCSLEKNIGANQNFINTVNACTGKYIAMCEGDDYWVDCYKLQKQVDFLEANSEYTIHAHNAIFFHQQNKSSSLFNPILDKQTYHLTDLIEKNWFVPTASMVFCKSIFDSYVFDTRFKNGDYYLQLLLLSSGEKYLYYSNEVMSVYRIGINGMSTTFFNDELDIGLIQLMEYMNNYTAQKFQSSFLKKIEILNNKIVDKKIQKEREQLLSYRAKRLILNIFKRTYILVKKLFCKPL